MVAPGAPVLGLDVGPANALLDAAACRFPDRPRDLDGARAAAGRRRGAQRHTLGAAGGARRRPLAAADHRRAGGVPAQFREAYAFALLGWLSWHGPPAAIPSVTGARQAAVLGSWTPSGPARAATPAVPPRRLVIAP